MDDFESALRHAQREPPHPLIVEIHASLLNIIIRDPLGARPLSTYGDSHADRSGSELSWVGREGLSEARLIDAGKEVSDGYIGTGTLKPKDGRKGWEAALVGILIDVSPARTLFV